MTTPLDIITLALKDIGVVGIGQTPNAEDTNDAFRKMNWMLALWQRKRWLVYHLVDLSVVSTGAQTYSIGPSGAINFANRPDKIEAAYVVQPVVSGLPVTYSLSLIMAREDYAKITLKTLPTFPSYLFYDSAWPLGLLYPWPIPQANIYVLHVVVKDILGPFTSLAQVVNLPPEYEGVIEQNLAVRLAPGYSKQADPLLIQQAQTGLNALRDANAQIASLQMPDSLRGGGNYNVYSDQVQ